MSLLKAFMSASLLLSVSWAQAEVNCDKVANYKQVIECAEARSPEILKAENNAQEKAARVDAASQWQNPELSFQTLSGTMDSDKKEETDVSLSFPIELGGKRAARKKVASVDEAKAQWELFRAKSDLRRDIALKLVRLGQIDREIDLIDESIGTFTKLVKQYEGRPARSPEQDVTLTVFKIARSEYDLKRTEYDEELSALESYFAVTTGLKVSELKKIVMPEVTKLPFPSASTDKMQSSPLAAAYEFDVQMARGELDKEVGDSWPTLNIGPSAKISKEAGRELQQWGVNVSLPLPVFNANGAGRAAASAAVLSAENRKAISLKQLEADRALLLKTFRKVIASLKDSPNSSVLDSKHKKIESHFLKGTVPSSLIIEAHRSLVDFEKARNEHELKAFAAFFSIQLIDGENVGVNL